MQKSQATSFLVGKQKWLFKVQAQKEEIIGRNFPLILRSSEKVVLQNNKKLWAREGGIYPP